MSELQGGIHKLGGSSFNPMSVIIFVQNTFIMIMDESCGDTVKCTVKPVYNGQQPQW